MRSIEKHTSSHFKSEMSLSLRTALKPKKPRSARSEQPGRYRLRLRHRIDGQALFLWVGLEILIDHIRCGIFNILYVL